MKKLIFSLLTTILGVLAVPTFAQTPADVRPLITAADIATAWSKLPVAHVQGQIGQMAGFVRREAVPNLAFGQAKGVMRLEHVRQEYASVKYVRFIPTADIVGGMDSYLLVQKTIQTYVGNFSIPIRAYGFDTLCRGCYIDVSNVGIPNADWLSLTYEVYVVDGKTSTTTVASVEIPMIAEQSPHPFDNATLKEECSNGVCRLLIAPTESMSGDIQVAISWAPATVTLPTPYSGWSVEEPNIYLPLGENSVTLCIKGRCRTRQFAHGTPWTITKGTPTTPQN